MARPPRRPKSDRFLASSSAPGPARSTALPSPAELAAFVRDGGDTDLGELARHFAVKGADRRALREMLRSLQGAGGDLAKRGRKGVAARGSLPPVGVADVVDRDEDGDLWVKLAKGEDAPTVRLAPDKEEARAGAPGMGDRLLVKFTVQRSGRDRGAADPQARRGRAAHAGRGAQVSPGRAGAARCGWSRWIARPVKASCSPAQKPTP